MFFFFLEANSLEWRCNEGKCYALSEGPTTFRDAIEFCRVFDATLVKIESEVENDFVREFCGERSCWIGLSEPADSEEWFWQDESAPTFFNW